MNTLSLPQAAEPLLLSFSVAFSEPTFQRFLRLIVGAILARDARTVTAMLRTLGPLAPGHFSSYHRVFSRAAWSLWPLAAVLGRWILDHLPEDQPVIVSVDDTTAGHPGDRVYAKGCHHDAVRSSHRHAVFRWGHRWVVMAIHVPLPFTSRAWALPVLTALYRTEALNHAEGRRHKTPPVLARQLMAVLIRWFASRRFVLLGDGGFATHDLARFARRHRHRVTLVSRFHGNAGLYERPPKRKPGQKGRPRVKGARLPKPQERVACARPKLATVTWYGGKTRQVTWVSDLGHWYRNGAGLALVRWVFVRDRTGTHRDEYFFTTDPDLSPERIISLYTARWSIETTFQELRRHLGFETPRQRVAASVLRMAPCLMGLFSLISLIYARHLRGRRPRPRGTAWYAKSEPTFSDAIAEVRRLFWIETIFNKASHKEAFQKLPRKLRTTLLDCICQAA